MITPRLIHHGVVSLVVHFDLSELVAKVEASKWVESKIFNWLEAFLLWEGSCSAGRALCPGWDLAAVDFYGRVQLFLGSPDGQDFKDHIVWDETGLGIHSSRMPFFHPASLADSSEDQEACVIDLRKIMSDDPIGFQGFPFGKRLPPGESPYPLHPPLPSQQAFQ